VKLTGKEIFRLSKTPDYHLQQMRTRPKLDDDKIPAWTYDGSEPGIYTFASALALAGLEDQMISLSADLQTQLLGHNVFAHQPFMLRQDGTYLVSRKVCFGAALESHEGPLAELARASKSPMRVARLVLPV
jgi:hypothetical protein